MRSTVDTVKRLVEILRALDEPKSMYALAEGLKLRYQTVMKYVDDLEELGWVTKEIDTSSTPPRYIIKRTKLGACIAKCFSSE